MRVLLFSLFIFSASAQAKLLFVNLNHSKDNPEIKACKRGLEAAGKGADELQVIQGAEGRDDEGFTNTFHALRAELRSMRETNAQLRRRGQPPNKFEGIVLSGDHDNGLFFGKNGEFHARELRRLLREFPEFEDSLQTSALWGCYPSTKHAADNFWVRPIKNMKFSIGFPGQAPAPDKAANTVILQHYCETYQQTPEAARDADEEREALCKMYESYPKIKFQTAFGMCSREAFASHLYLPKGTKDWTRPEVNKCFTHKDLEERCGEYINDDKMWNEYEDFYEGRRIMSEDDPSKPNGPRKFYDQLHLWRHCAKQYPKKLPPQYLNPPNVLRLVKYDTIKTNLMQVNGREIAEYDQQMDKRGLDNFKLGDITQVPRAELNRRIRGAKMYFGGQKVDIEVSRPQYPRSARLAANEGASFIFGNSARSRNSEKMIVQGEREEPMLRMATCMDATLIRMSYECSNPDHLTKKPKTQSHCLRSYEESTSPRGSDEPC